MFLEKKRLESINKAANMFLDMKRWCNNLLSADEIVYIRDKHGIVGFDMAIFLLIFYPIFYCWSFGFNGVPFPFNFLKKKNKKRSTFSEKSKNKKKKISNLDKDVSKISSEIKELEKAQADYSKISSVLNNNNSDTVDVYDEYGRRINSLKEEITIVKNKRKRERKILKKMTQSHSNKVEKKTSGASHSKRREKRLAEQFATGGVEFLNCLLNKKNWDCVYPRISRQSGFIDFLNIKENRLSTSLPAETVLDFSCIHMDVIDYFCVKYTVFSRPKLEDILRRRLEGLHRAVINDESKRDDI